MQKKKKKLTNKKVQMILERCGESVTEDMALLLGRWTRGHRRLEWVGILQHGWP